MAGRNLFAENQEPIKKAGRNLFADSPAPQQDDGFFGAGVIEPAANIISGAAAEPIAGLAGIAQSLNPLAEEGAGVRAIEATRKALTFAPRTKAGKENLQSFGEALAPVGEVLSGVENTIGDTVFEITGSPALAAFAKSLPTAFLEIIGFKGGGRLARQSASIAPSSKQVKSLLNEATPSAAKLREVSGSVFKELSESGINIKPQAYNRLVKGIEESTRKAGLDRRTTTQAAGAIEALKEVNIGRPVPLSELDILRKVAQGVAKNIDPTEKALGVKIIDRIDDFIEKVQPNQLTNGKIKANEIGKKYNVARKLYGRAKKSELVQEAIEVAKGRASGFENGIRIELGKLIKNKRTKNFFTKSERAAIRSIESGNAAQNFTKFLGRFAFNEGRSNNVLTALSGVGAGSLLGGPIGAIAVPVIGTTARRIAKNVTKSRADFVDNIIRAGDDGKLIAETYFKSVPQAKRSVSDLSDLLSDPNINLDSLLESAKSRTKQAAEIAAGRQVIGEALGTVSATATKETVQQNENQ